ncbi:hypothetical protein [Sphaerisporangium dianthi]|uniref:Tetracyclin repressor-like MT0489/Rv0472c C-terminal domain-containing protein n=1 Tax=Sphaerisporangium dianthi TaxID=1436120 RepID=A0ABV9CPL7_9ACTN
MAAIVRGLGEELGAVIAAGGTVADPVRAQILGHAFVGMVHTTGDWWLEHPEVDRAQVADTLTTAVLATLTGAFGAPPAERPAAEDTAIPRPAESAITGRSG